jgi:hypothetical protein
MRLEFLSVEASRCVQNTPCAPHMMGTVTTLLGTVWFEILNRNGNPSWGHPQFRRWGVWRKKRETMLYLGRVFVILTPRGVA